MSTAFVAGTHRGTFREADLERGHAFHNNYERSKWEAERLVREHSDRLPVQIIRPSIVVGDERSGWTASFNVIYAPLRAYASGVLRAIPPSLYRRTMHPLVLRRASAAGRRFLERTEVFFPYFACRARFDDASARAGLEPAGIAAPPVASYFDRLMEFALWAEWGRRPVGRVEARAAGPAHRTRATFAGIVPGNVDSTAARA